MEADNQEMFVILVCTCSGGIQKILQKYAFIL